MAQVLVNVVFSIVTTIFNFFFSPFINALFLLFPDLTTYIQHVQTFLNYAFTYVTCLCRLILLDSNVLSVIFAFLIIKYGIWVLTTAIRFGFRMYNLLKP